MIEREVSDGELETLIIRVHLTTGQIKEHKYPIANIQERSEIMNIISNSFAKKTWHLSILHKDIPQILSLHYPRIIYNPSHILFIEHELIQTL